MSDDIFRDIWQKLADIYGRITQAVANVAAGGNAPQGGGASFATPMTRVTQTIASALSKLPALFLKVSAAIGIVVSAFGLLAKAVHSATKAQLEQQRELGKVNAQIARSFAISDVLDMLREGRFASATAPSTERLNEAFTKLKDALVPMRAAWTNLVNKTLGLLNRIVTPVVNALSAVVTPILNLASAIVDLPERIYNAIADAFRTDEERRKAEEQRQRDRAIGSQAAQLPVARMFNSILQRDWAAVTDSRKPLF